MHPIIEDHYSFGVGRVAASLELDGSARRYAPGVLKRMVVRALRVQTRRNG
jgi:hypothetical protein